jgi:copper chaperone
MLRFHIPNMTCGGCAKGVTATLKEADPAAKVEIALDTRQVTLAGESADAAAIEKALQEAGWDAARIAA